MTDLDLIIADTVSHLEKGEIILYPTDTIWGIVCDATDPEAVNRIFEVKKRPEAKSVLLLVSSIDMVRQYVDRVPNVVTNIVHLEKRPLTIVYPGAKNLPEILLAEDGSIGIRITRDELCKQVVARLGKPIVSTSANFSGDPFPKSFDDINPSLIRQVDFIVPWKQQDISPNIPSKIIKIEPSGEYTIIRE